VFKGIAPIQKKAVSQRHGFNLYGQFLTSGTVAEINNWGIGEFLPFRDGHALGEKRFDLSTNYNIIN